MNHSFPALRHHVALAAALVAVLIHAPTSEARPKYKTEFQKLYPHFVKKLGKQKTACTVCHPRRSKQKRNDYGVAFTKKLGSIKVNDLQKINQALNG